jgi:hypothetical protein
MPEYVLNRNYTLRTTNGVVSFEKGQPTWVVPMMERDAVAIGAERVDGDAPNPLGEVDSPKLPVFTPDERTAQMIAAFELLIERNDSKDFTGQGVPSVKAIEKITGFDVERSEVLETWMQYKIDKAE